LNSELTREVRYLKGVGPDRAERLLGAGVRTVEDLLRLFPVGYLDRGRIVPIGRARPGDDVTVEGRVRSVHAVQTRRLPLARVTIEDDSGTAVVLFFNQPWITRSVHVGDLLTVSGEMDGGGELRPRAYEVADEGEEPAHAAGIVPRYGVGGVPIRWFRKLMRRVVEEHAPVVEDPLPEGLRRRRGLIPPAEAILRTHFPPGWAELEEARRSLAYEEFFLLEVMLALRRAGADRVPGIRIDVPPKVQERIRARLGFRLTPDQEKAWAQITRDLSSGRPMNRLLQGDVGCGKTAVAAAAILAVVASRRQAALMAPTEILAEQHHRTFGRWLEGSRVRIAWLRGGGRRDKAREALLAQIAAGEQDLVIATHALIERDVTFASLALAVIDEQHRFGVAQRGRLAAKGPGCHVLVMTATPIPRTLAMTLYGDLDVSVIRQMPPGRRPIATRFERDRAEVLRLVRARLREGRQAFFVYPLIDDSDKLPLKAAKAAFEELAAALPEFRVGLLHGKMKREQKDKTMDEFREGRLNVLVSTIVVEVGIDVPNATIMVIDHAERYGLAQLHQLRGRIGRGAHASTCILLGDPRSPDARARVEAMVRSADGFALAEEDLKLRGPGELLGTSQSGWPFRHGDPVRDVSLLSEAREDGFDFARRDPAGAARLRRRTLDRLRWAEIG
jgi:ATP-dependent DNA helicase RecG